MAIVNEIIVTGRVKRRLIDKAAKLWQKISYWTKASDVEFDDGKTAEEKVGDINGITSDFTVGQDDIAASSFITKKIKTDLNAGKINDRIQLVIQPDGTLGWKKDGADAVIPFKGKVKGIIDNPAWLWTGGPVTLSGVKNGDGLAVFVAGGGVTDEYDGGANEDSNSAFYPSPDFFVRLDGLGMVGVWNKINFSSVVIDGLHHKGGVNCKMMYFTF